MIKESARQNAVPIFYKPAAVFGNYENRRKRFLFPLAVA